MPPKTELFIAHRSSFIVSVMKPNLTRFLILQAVLLSIGTAWGAVRWQSWKAELELPAFREEPLTVRPTYDMPVVVGDDQLRRVLLKLRPRNLGAKTKINHIDHALRFWTPHAKFDDPAFFSGEQLRGVLTDTRQFMALYGPTAAPLLSDGPYGVRVRVQEGLQSSSHVDHTVAGLAEVGTPLTFPVVTPTHVTTYRAMLEQALHDFSLNQIEYEWTALAMISFLPPAQGWRTAEGQEITFDRIAQRLMREELPRGVCFGNHRLHTLTMFLRIDDEQHVLTPGTRAEIIGFLCDNTVKLIRHQHSDGYWDGKWPDQPAGSDVNVNLSGDGLADRILATGHALEWWALAPQECHPPREVLAKAGQWMVRTIDNLTPEQTENYFTYLSHAGRALALWRGKLPYEVDLTTTK